MNIKNIRELCAMNPEEISAIDYDNLKFVLFNSLGTQDAIRLLQQWCRENLLTTDWSMVPVDTPVIVWNSYLKHQVERPYHFAKCEHGDVYVWADGLTSWTASRKNNEMLKISACNIALAEELKDKESHDEV